MIDIPVTVVKGFQVASGLATNSPYPLGTIAMQQPFFTELGLDLTDFFPATINVRLPVNTIEILRCDHLFTQVKWSKHHAAESFCFVHCGIRRDEQAYDAVIYYPLPATKLEHFHDKNILEIIAPKIAALNYGDTLYLRVDDNCLLLSE